jgi:hypothetical protein
MGPAQIVVAGARNARPEQKYAAFLLVPLGLLRFHLGLVAARQRPTRIDNETDVIMFPALWVM